MISVVMATLNSERDLVEALSPLIPASVDGLVRELVVSDSGSSDGTLAILDVAGAVLAEGGLNGAAQAARGPWLLVIASTSRLTYEWPVPARRHLDVGKDRAVRLVRHGLFAKAEALLIRKADYLAGGRGRRRLKI